MHDTTVDLISPPQHPMPPRVSLGQRARNAFRMARRMSKEARERRGWLYALGAPVFRLCWRVLLLAGLLTCTAALLAPESCAPATELHGVNVPQTFAAARLHAVAAAEPASRLLRERGLDAERLGDIVVPAVAHACERATPWLHLGSQRGGELLDELRAIALECGLPAASRTLAAVRKAFASSPRASVEESAASEQPSEASAASVTSKERHGTRLAHSSGDSSEQPLQEAHDPSALPETA